MTFAEIHLPADILTAIGVALAAAGGVSGATILLARRQRVRVLALGRSLVDTDALRVAAQRAQDDRSELIKDVLRTAVGDVAEDQKLGPGLVRGAVFGLTGGGTIAIVDDLAVNFDKIDEQTRLLSGESGVGEVVRSDTTVVTVFDDPRSSSADEPGESEVIDPALRWTIALPIGLADGRPLWVLRVDGLVESRSEGQLESSVARLLYYRELLELLLKGLARS